MWWNHYITCWYPYHVHTISPYLIPPDKPLCSLLRILIIRNNPVGPEYCVLPQGNPVFIHYHTKWPLNVEALAHLITVPFSVRKNAFQFMSVYFINHKPFASQLLVVVHFYIRLSSILLLEELRLIFLPGYHVRLCVWFLKGIVRKHTLPSYCVLGLYALKESEKSKIHGEADPE